MWKTLAPKIWNDFWTIWLLFSVLWFSDFEFLFVVFGVMVLRLAFLGWTFIFISDFLVYQRHSCVFPSFSFLVLSVVLISSLPADFMICVLGWSTWSLSPSSHRPTQIQFRPSIAKFINFLITRKIGLRSSKWLLSLISSIWSPSIVTASRSVPSGGRRKKTQPDAGRDETAQRGDRVGRALWWYRGQPVLDRWETFPSHMLSWCLT